MKFKLKYLAAGTLACLTTVSTATHSATYGFQSDQPSLQSMLQMPPRANSLLPRPVSAVEPAEGVVQQVAFITQDGSSPGRLLPRPATLAQPSIPTLAPAAPTAGPQSAGGAARPLVPIRGGSSEATALPAPIVSGPTRPTTPATTSSLPVPSSQVPIVTPSTVGRTSAPIITSPLPSHINKSVLGAPVGSSVSPTLDVTAPAPILGTLPPTIATPTTTPIAPINSGKSASGTATGTAITGSSATAQPSATPAATRPTAITAPTIPTVPAIPVGPISSKATTNRAPADDEIEVTEMSVEAMAEMMQAFGSKPKLPSSTISTTKERVESIGTGSLMTPGQPAIPAVIGSGTNGISALPTSAPQMIEPVYETYGLNLGHERPDMPSRLPYDGYGTISGASGYAHTEFLYMARDGGDFSVSYAPQRDAYDFEPGVRLTIGNRWDSLEGREIGVTLLQTQTSHTSVASPTNSLFSWLQPGNGFTDANLSSFNNASFHHSFYKSHYYAGEYNRMSWNWDVMSTFIGLRYTGMDELYALHSVGSGGGLGAYRLRARNHMVGPQVGGSLHYDIGRKLSFSLAAKIAVYANFYQTDTELANESVRLMDVNDSRVDLAWGSELGGFAHYSLTPRARLKAGYELWFYDRVATSRDQMTGFVSPFSGAVANNRDEALFYGFSVGLELFR